MVADKYMKAPGQEDAVDAERLREVLAEMERVAVAAGVELGESA